QVDALAEETFEGELARISPVVDPQTGTFKVTIEMPQPDPRLKPGMFGRVSVVYDEHDEAITIPQDALVVEDKERYVYRVDGQRAKRVDVKVGYTTDGSVEILDGLEPGEQVVTAGKGSITDETLLDVINLLEPDSASVLAERIAETETSG
ncbi:MAG: efflux RND transporter periplasmic adaptor subunit, partial [Pseudomonadota bacterium]